MRIRRRVGVVVVSLHYFLDDSSYSPGLLRPSLSNTTSLRELIHEIHKHSMSVIIDLNWESFKRSTLFGSYHGYYAKCRII